ncbi:MAG: ribonuclease P protein component [Nitriliruptor sp.]|nr:MAG: ribonuclease P protein component [Nitriliruptor sp.]
MTSGTVARLRNGRDIATVLQGRHQRGGRLLGVHRGPGLSDHPARIAVVASRRVGGAVQRNRAKRLIREAVQRIDWCPEVDVVIVARRACAHSDLAAVQSELGRLAAELELSREGL